MLPIRQTDRTHYWLLPSPEGQVDRGRDRANGRRPDDLGRGGRAGLHIKEEAAGRWGPTHPAETHAPEFSIYYVLEEGSFRKHICMWVERK